MKQPSLKKNPNQGKDLLLFKAFRVPRQQRNIDNLHTVHYNGHIKSILILNRRKLQHFVNKLITRIIPKSLVILLLCTPIKTTALTLKYFRKFFSLKSCAPWTTHLSQFENDRPSLWNKITRKDHKSALRKKHGKRKHRNLKIPLLRSARLTWWPLPQEGLVRRRWGKEVQGSWSSFWSLRRGSS